jgi:DNA-binding NarL/FixJ family response regulator
MPTDFRILVATGRPGVGDFFTAMSHRGSPSVSTTVVDLNPATLTKASRALSTASVAVVDVAVHRAEALDLCAELLARRRDLPIGALFCCPHAVAPMQLRALLAAGLSSFLDLQLSADQSLTALRAVARGEDVVCLQLTSEARKVLFNGNGNGEELGAEERALLRLLELGMTDHEIGGQLCLSHHTIKHRIERLRRRANARNRVQLAAWAAHQQVSDGVAGRPAVR